MEFTIFISISNTVPYCLFHSRENFVHFLLYHSPSISLLCFPLRDGGGGNKTTRKRRRRRKDTGARKEDEEGGKALWHSAIRARIGRWAISRRRCKPRSKKFTETEKSGALSQMRKCSRLANSCVFPKGQRSKRGQNFYFPVVFLAYLALSSPLSLSFFALPRLSNFVLSLSLSRCQKGGMKCPPPFPASERKRKFVVCSGIASSSSSPPSTVPGLGLVENLGRSRFQVPTFFPHTLSTRTEEKRGKKR